MEGKKRVEIYDRDDGAVYERLLLTDEQIRLMTYLDNHDCLNECVRFRVLDNDSVYHEV